MNKITQDLSLLYAKSSDSPPKHNTTVIAKADSAATSHYWRNQDLHCLSNIEKYSGPSVTLPDNTQIAPARQGLLPLPKEFSKTACTATNLPSLKSSSLLATGPLCDDGKVVIFDKDKVHVIQNNNNIRKMLKSSPVLLQGHRNSTDGCWDIPVFKTVLQQNNFRKPLTHSGLYPSRQNVNSSVKQVCETQQTQPLTGSKILKAFKNRTLPKLRTVTNNLPEIIKEFTDIDKATVSNLSTPNKHTVNIIIRKDKLKPDLANFHHASMFSPVRSTLLKAIENNQLTTFPGLTKGLITKHLQNSVFTSKGHQNQ